MLLTHDIYISSFPFVCLPAFYSLFSISKVRLLVLILHSQNLKDAQSIHFARRLQLPTRAPMVDSLFFEDMQMIVYLHWLV